MKQVYVAAEPLTAHVVREVLQSKGFFAVVRDEHIFGLRGEVGSVYPSVWVHEKDYAETRKLVDAFEAGQRGASARPAWTCPQCGERIEGHFTECWKCPPEAGDSAGDAAGDA